MKTLILDSPIVDADFLSKKMSAPNLVILDATMASAGQKDFVAPTIGIGGARHIDIKKDFSLASSLPNMLTTEEGFTAAAQRLGIHQNTAIVVYDQKGVYSSPRVWWMFRTMGHKNIAVLDGGLPHWTAQNHPTGPLGAAVIEGDFQAVQTTRWLRNKSHVEQSITNPNVEVMDARSSGRFHGTSPEPRPELRSGHIPGSHSLPYGSLVRNGFYIEASTIRERILQPLTDNPEDIIFSCGSGITACILHLGAEIAGIKNTSVYDGSWSEWGLLEA